MRCSLIAVVLILVSPLISRGAPPAPPRVEMVLPRETQVVVIVRDLPGVVKKLQGHPWALGLVDEQMARFFAPLLRVFDQDNGLPAWEKEIGMSWREVLGQFPGQVAFAWDFKLPDKPGPGNQIPTTASTIFIADIGDKTDAIRKLLSEPAAPADPNAGRTVVTTEQFEGVTLTLRTLEFGEERIDDGGWAIVGRQLVRASPTPSLKGIVHELLKPSGDETRLADSPAFQRYRAEQANDDMVVFANVPAVARLLTEMFAADQPPASLLLPWDYFKLTPNGISHVLGMDAIETMYFSVNFEKQSTDLTLGMLHERSRDLLRVLAFEQGVPRADLIPEDALGAFSVRFNSRQAWTAIRELTRNFRITNDVMQDWLKEMQQQVGVDIETDIVATLGQQISVASFAPSQADKTNVAELEPTDRLIVIELKDPKRFQTALGKLIQWANAYDEQVTSKQHANVTVYSFASALVILPAGTSLQMAVVGQSLVVGIGHDDFFEKFLTRNAAGKGRGFWDRPNIRPVVDRAPPTVVAIGSTDGPAAFWSFWTTAYEGARLLEEVINVEAPPDIEVVRKYLASVVTFVTSTEHSKILRIQLVYPKK